MYSNNFNYFCARENGNEYGPIIDNKKMKSSRSTAGIFALKSTCYECIMQCVATVHQIERLYNW